MILPFAQPIDTSAAQSDSPRLSEAEWQQNLSLMSEDQKHVMEALGSHIQTEQHLIQTKAPQAALLAQQWRWFITGGAGAGKSFVIKMLREAIHRAYPSNISANPVMLTAPKKGNYEALTTSSNCHKSSQVSTCFAA